MDISNLYALFLHHRTVSTDTRQITPGSIFFALQGAHFDGNSFANQALAAGASLAVVSDPALTGDSFFYVDNTLEALQALARFHRQHLRIPVLAITGSNGKTTTKEVITTVLSSKYLVHATKGNLNNHIGVPLTILSTPETAEILVCEMGANHIGEIRTLCQIAEPTHGLITNIGMAHLEGFGSYEGVIQAKGELFAYLHATDGYGFVNGDDPAVAALGQKLRYKTTYGLNPESSPEMHFQILPTTQEFGFTIADRHSGTTLRSPLFGVYNAINVLAAYCVGRHFDIRPGLIADQIGAFRSGVNRSEITQWKGCTIIKDAYNANPSSMDASIKAFEAKFPDGILVLGDMKELGQDSALAHQHIITQVSQGRFFRIYLVGSEFRKAADVIGVRDQLFRFAESIEGLKNEWDWVECLGHALLIKGSRSMHLEQLLTE